MDAGFPRDARHAASPQGLSYPSSRSIAPQTSKRTPKKLNPARLRGVVAESSAWRVWGRSTLAALIVSRGGLCVGAGIPGRTRRSSASCPRALSSARTTARSTPTRRATTLAAEGRSPRQSGVVVVQTAMFFVGQMLVRSHFGSSTLRRAAFAVRRRARCPHRPTYLFFSESQHRSATHVMIWGAHGGILRLQVERQSRLRGALCDCTVDGACRGLQSECAR